MRGKPRLLPGCLLLVGVLLTPAACSRPVDQEGAQTTDVTVFEGARLLVGDGTQPIEDATFVVDGGRITAVGRRGELQVPAGAARVDLTGKTVMPTIVDLHSHFRGPREDFVDGLERQAYFGVGAILSIGSPADLSSDLKNNPVPGGALYLDGGRGIRGPEDRAAGVTNEADARRVVQEHVAQKVDMIKIYVDDRYGEVETLTPAMYRALIDEADTHGFRVYAHLRFLRDAKELLRAGLHGFAHCVRDQVIDEEFVSMMKERPEVFLVPTLPPRGVMPDLSWISDAYPPEVFEEFLKEARTGTTPLAFGLQRPREPFAIQAANLMRLQIVLDANPLDDITNTRRIAEVYIRGTAVDRPALRARWTGGAWRRHANS